MEINTDSLKKFFTETSVNAIRNSMMSLIDLDYYKNFLSEKKDSKLEESRQSMMQYLDKSKFKDN